MSDENKPDNIDDGDDLLSDFNDLFPEEDDDNLNELDASDEDDDLESLLEGLDAPTESGQGSGSDEDHIDALLDTLVESVSNESDADETNDSIEEISDTATDSSESSEADVEDNLDSLLDGLEEQVEEITANDSTDEEELDSLLDEMIEEVKPGEERELDLDNNELELSVDNDSEVPDESGSENVLEDLISTGEESGADPSVDSNRPDDSAEESSLDDLISMEEEAFSGDEQNMGAAATAAPASVATPPTDEEPVEPAEPATTDSPSVEESSSREIVEKSPSKIGAIAVYLLLFITLAVAGGSLWMTLQAQQAVDKNGVRLSKLQKQQDLALSDLGTPYNPLIEQNSSAIRDLDLRLNELSKMVEGPLSHMDANTGAESIGRLEERLQQLEQKMTQQLAELKEELAKRPTVVASTTSPPLMVKSQSNSKPAAKLWVLNLLSLASRKGASDTVKRLQKAGVDASRTRFIAKDGKTWYRVRVIGFSSYAKAKSYAKEMPKVKGIRKNQTWVTAE